MWYVDMLLELVMGYAALFITVKILGKTQISQITAFDFVSALVLGDMVGGVIFDERKGLRHILFAIAVWGALIFFTELATQKSRLLRKLFEGKPSLIINKGKIDWSEMKKNRLDMEQLMQLLRSKNSFSIQEVEYAIFETNGSISVLRKSDVDFPTCRDLNVQVERKTVPIPIINDGKVIKENLQEAGLNEEWLQNELEAGGIKKPKEICYAEYQSGKPLYYQKYS